MAATACRAGAVLPPRPGSAVATPSTIWINNPGPKNITCSATVGTSAYSTWRMTRPTLLGATTCGAGAVANGIGALTVSSQAPGASSRAHARRSLSIAFEARRPRVEACAGRVGARAGVEPLAQRGLHITKALGQRYLARTHVVAAAAFDAIHQAVGFECIEIAGAACTSAVVAAAASRGRPRSSCRSGCTASPHRAAAGPAPKRR